MARLTKVQAKMHAEAVALLAQPELSSDEREFVRAHWQESAEHVNSAAGAFFTPWSQALDFALEVPRNGKIRLLDLCAGIGNLSAAVWERTAFPRHWGETELEIVCVELNPAYVEVGKKLLPEARWITGSIFDLPSDLGHFDVVVSNPPFGAIDRGGASAPRFRGREFEYHVIDLAADLAEYGAFILPQSSAPFRYSGAPHYEWDPPTKYDRFEKQTGLRLDCGIGVDTSVYADEWHGVKVVTEHCIVDFDEWRREQGNIQKRPDEPAPTRLDVSAGRPADDWDSVFAEVAG